MNPETLQVLLQLFERNLRFGSPLMQQAFARLVRPQDSPPDESTQHASHSDLPGSHSLLDALHAQQLMVEELTRIHGLLLELLMSPWLGSNAVASDPPPAADEPFATETFVPEGQVLAPEPPIAADAEADVTPRHEREGDAETVLKQAERLLLLHPMAAQAAFSALVGQGRRFAATPEGEQLARALSKAPILKKLRRIWETTTLNMLEEHPTTVLPNMYVETIFRAARSANLEELLSVQRVGGTAL